jgi:3-methyladenine DNA glycosylase AlkD
VSPATTADPAIARGHSVGSVQASEDQRRDRRSRAEALGRSLADDLSDPAVFAHRLETGLVALADAASLAETKRVAPGIGQLHGVRWPLLEAIQRGFREATRRERTSSWLFVVDRLLRQPTLEERWFAFGLLERLVADEPERAWQLLRRAAREAADWITVDSLAHPVGAGILNEAYRWAELEQLVFSPSRWERRLVGSTIATIPFVDRTRGRTGEVARHGLELVGELIGDDQPDVQKALAWALRAMAMIDQAATTAFLETETRIAVDESDGYRAWVIRDVLPKLDPAAADQIRRRLDGIRRRAGSPPTSRAAAAAARFGGGRLGAPMPEPPLT